MKNTKKGILPKVKGLHLSHKTTVHHTEDHSNNIKNQQSLRNNFSFTFR